MIECKVYEGENAAVGAKIALENRLYVSGWNLSGTLVQIRKYPINKKVAIVFKEDAPVAVATLSHGKECQAFCRKEERRKGYASVAVKSLGEKNIYYMEGIDGSMNFWHTVTSEF